MALVFDKIGDTVTGSAYPAFWRQNPDSWLTSSPNGHWVAGGFSSEERSKIYLADVSTSPPSLVWGANLQLADVPGIEVTDFFHPIAVDDAGDIWGSSDTNDGKVIRVPKDTHTPELAFAWTNENGMSGGKVMRRIFTHTTSGNAIKVVVVPGGSAPDGSSNNHLVYLGTKGTPGLTETDLTTWTACNSFIDDHDDVWVAGCYQGNAGPTTTLNLQRLTSNGSAYTSPLSITMPVAGSQPLGYFSNGHYVGIWSDGNQSTLAFSVNLTDGSLATNAIDPVFNGDRAVFGAFSVYDSVAPSNPNNFFVWLVSDDQARTVVQIKPDLTIGDTWDLDQWTAGDTSVDGVTSDVVVHMPIFIDGQTAFAGIRGWVDPVDDNIEHGELFVYRFGDTPPGGSGGGDGVTDDAVTIRCWTYSLDGHDYYVIRLGPSETLVYDLTTGSWSEWRSPGRTNWRAHVGCNWVGMSAATLNRGWGSDVVAGDDATGTLWILDPTYGRDDRTTSGHDYITSCVVGGIQITGRDSIPCNAVQLDLALGSPTEIGSTILLETSDDFGHTWDNQGTVTVEPGEFDQTVEWRSLGRMRAPGRVFRITDTGATVRISGLDLR